MAEESLEVRLNLYRKFAGSTPESGMLVAYVKAEDRARYMAGNFGELVDHAMENIRQVSQHEQLSSEQKDSYNAIRSKIENEAENSRVRLKLYDKDHRPIRVSGDAQREIYLSDTVSNRVDSDIDYLGIGIDTSTGVGC